ncbi:MAG: aminoacyl-tRNA hydrolase [Candidatus Nanopelagicales bacterium]
MTEGPWVAVGLGNPGDRYAATRHNVGRMVVERMAEVAGQGFRPNRRARCDVAEVRVGAQRCVLAVPHSYMNESGGPVSGVLRYFHAEPSRLIVVQDEIDLPFGALRVKFGGGDNGHNGLKSIRRSLDTGDWYRIRVGVGRGRGDTADHVLARFARHEAAPLAELVDTAGDCVESLIGNGLELTQNRFNS